MKYLLYPLGMCRLAGVPFDRLEELHFRSSEKLHAVVDRRERQLDVAKSALEKALHLAVGAGAGERRQALVRAARNLRRKDKLSPTQEAEVRRNGLGRRLDVWHGRKDRLAAAMRDLESAWERDRFSSRSALRELAGGEAFLQGLVLGSPTLYESFEKTRGVPLEELPDNRAQRRLELGLLKYLTRAAAKTTPFSTFTSTLPASFAAEDALIELPDVEPRQSWVSLNKELYSILDQILRGRSELFSCYDVTLNPSLLETPEGYMMLVARAGREQLLRLPDSPAVEHTLDLIAGRGGTMPYDELAGELAAAFGLDPAAIRPRLNRMIDAGILQLNSSIPDWEQGWAPRLADRLKGSSHPWAARIRRLLDDLEADRAAYAGADPARRKTLLESAGGRLSETLAALEAEAADGEKPVFDERKKGSFERNPFYEDTWVEAPVRLHQDRLSPVLEALGGWLDWMSRLSPKVAFQRNLREHFDRHYGNARSVPFLIFYRGFFAEVYEELLRYDMGRTEKSWPEVANPYGLDELPRRVAAYDRFAELLHEMWDAAPRADELHFDRALLEDSLRGVEPPPGPASSMVFAQLLPRSAGWERDSIVLDKQLAHPGMGKYFSRFLFPLDRRISDDLRAHNARHRDYLVAELCDDSEFSFNANLHPRLTDYEINYPANVTGLRPETNLALGELDVCPAGDPGAGGRLRLVHRGSGREVLPVDLGFLARVRRPPLFRVLELFSPLFHHRLNLPWRKSPRLAPRAATAEDGSEVLYRPRIVFEQRVLLSRRSWRVPAALLHEMVHETPPGDTLYRLNRWRRSQGMPRDVYFFLLPPLGETDMQATGKPQYLSFSSGLMVEMLLEVVRQHSGPVVFEEMLPTPEMLPRRRGSAYASEIILQLDRAP